jgi:hypothetical protein
MSISDGGIAAIAALSVSMGNGCAAFQVWYAAFMPGISL